jgi:hypothetical protein
VQFLTTSGEHAILFAELYLFHRTANAVGAGGAGRRDGIVDTADTERRGEAGGDGAAHGLGDAIGPDATQATLAQDVRRLGLAGGRGAPGAGDDARAFVGNLGFSQPRVVDRLLHCDVGVGRRIGHEAQLLAVDVFPSVDLRRAGDM